MDDKFDLTVQWNLYLERVGLKGKKMPVAQYREMKNTFFGACGQMLILLRDDLSELEDEEGIATLQNLLTQVGQHFLNTQGRQN